MRKLAHIYIIKLSDINVKPCGCDSLPHYEKWGDTSNGTCTSYWCHFSGFNTPKI